MLLADGRSRLITNLAVSHSSAQEVATIVATLVRPRAWERSKPTLASNVLRASIAPTVVAVELTPGRRARASARARILVQVQLTAPVVHSDSITVLELGHRAR